MPFAFFVTFYWRVLRVDNGMTRLSGDTTALIQKTCFIPHFADPSLLLLAHGDHVVLPLYLVTALILYVFHLSYLPYAIALVATFALAISMAGFAVRQATGSTLAAFLLVIMLSSGSWLGQALVTNYSEMVYALAMIFTLAALAMLLRRPFDPSLRNLLWITALCTLAALSVALGVIGFALVGCVWLLREAQIGLAHRRQPARRA